MGMTRTGSLSTLIWGDQQNEQKHVGDKSEYSSPIRKDVMITAKAGREINLSFMLLTTIVPKLQRIHQNTIELKFSEYTKKSWCFFFQLRHHHPKRVSKCHHEICLHSAPTAGVLFVLTVKKCSDAIYFCIHMLSVFVSYTHAMVMYIDLIFSYIGLACNCNCCYWLILYSI